MPPLKARPVEEWQVRGTGRPTAVGRPDTAV